MHDRAGKIIETLDFGCGRAGYDEFAYIRVERFRECDQLFPGRRDRKIGCDDVTSAIAQSGDELVARDGYEQDDKLARLAPKSLPQVFFKRPRNFYGKTTLLDSVVAEK